LPSEKAQPVASTKAEAEESRVSNSISSSSSDGGGGDSSSRSSASSSGDGANSVPTLPTTLSGEVRQDV